MKQRRAISEFKVRLVNTRRSRATERKTLLPKTKQNKTDPTSQAVMKKPCLRKKKKRKGKKKNINYKLIEYQNNYTQ